MSRKIIIELERIRVVYNRNPNRSVWCEFCGAESQPLTLNEACEIIGESKEAVYEFAEKGKLHVNESIEGETLICLNSLLKADELRF